jgi:hypothetical protein
LALAPVRTRSQPTLPLPRRSSGCPRINQLQRNRDGEPDVWILPVVEVVSVVVIDIDVIGGVPVVCPVFRPGIHEQERISAVRETRIAHVDRRETPDAEPMVTAEIETEAGLRNVVAAIASTLRPAAMIARPASSTILLPGAMPLPGALLRPSALLLPRDGLLPVAERLLLNLMIPLLLLRLLDPLLVPLLLLRPLDLLLLVPLLLLGPLDLLLLVPLLLLGPPDLLLVPLLLLGPLDLLLLVPLLLLRLLSPRLPLRLLLLRLLLGLGLLSRLLAARPLTLLLLSPLLLLLLRLPLRTLLLRGWRFPLAPALLPFWLALLFIVPVLLRVRGPSRPKKQQQSSGAHSSNELHSMFSLKVDFRYARRQPVRSVDLRHNQCEIILRLFFIQECMHPSQDFIAYAG